MKPTFEEIWRRIGEHAGETFTQIRGGEFTYDYKIGHISLSRTNQNLTKIDMKEAYGLVPMENTVPVQHLRGPSYIYAIMMDERIRKGDW